MKKLKLTDILRLNQTVFSFKEIILAFGEKNPDLLRRRISYYLKTGELYGIRRGLYAKDENYDKYELAVRIFTPSYISMETVLAASGIIYQNYNCIFVVSYQTKEINCDGKIYSFKKIKNSILTDNTGIENKKSFYIASVERAFLDVLYLNKEYYFDKLTSLNWEKVFALLPIYDNKRMKKKINQYYKKNKS